MREMIWYEMARSFLFTKPKNIYAVWLCTSKHNASNTVEKGNIFVLEYISNMI